jgi:hypothetical protein
MELLRGGNDLKRVIAVSLILVFTVLFTKIPISYAARKTNGYEFANAEDASAYILKNISLNRCNLKAKAVTVRLPLKSEEH